MTHARGPDFLCIGAPKTGTTWLYKHLSRHPEIWIPPVKELHHFDRLFPLPRAGDKVGVRRGFFGLFPHHDLRKVIRIVLRSVARGSMSDLGWTMRYFGGNGTDEWYRSLFERAGQRTCGELTTDYCALERAGVHHVRSMLPYLRIVFLMRNPIDRDWSHAKMLLPELLGKPLPTISTREFLDYLTHSGPRARGDYIRTLDNWQGEFPVGQVFIGFYEDLDRRPQDFLRDILTFLGVSALLPDLGIDFARRVNPGSSELPSAPPPEVATLLARLHLPNLETLAARFRAPASEWLEDARAILETGSRNPRLSTEPLRATQP